MVSRAVYDVPEGGSRDSASLCVLLFEGLRGVLSVAAEVWGSVVGRVDEPVGLIAWLPRLIEFSLGGFFFFPCHPSFSSC